MNEVFDHKSERNRKIDEFEATILNEIGVGEAPIRHIFSEGVYVREMTAYAGSFITSQVHKTEHIFIVSKGSLLVSMDDGSELVIEAPYTGITKPNTRRAAYVISDLVWSTIHVTDIKPENDSEEAVEEAVRLIGEQIIEPHENYVLGGILKNNELTKSINN